MGKKDFSKDKNSKKNKSDDINIKTGNMTIVDSGSKDNIYKTAKTSKRNSSNFKEIYPILPLIILVFFLPFIIRLKLIPLEGVFYDYWTGQRTSTDFFTYYKQIFIYLIAIWSLLHTFFFAKKIKWTKAYYFMGAYALLVILSTVFSDFPDISLYGFVERKEGMWIILSYITLMFSAINLVNSQFKIKTIIYSIGISGAFISLIGILQYAGMDIFASDIMKSLIIPSDILSRVEEFNIKLGEKYAYSVFYNPNYLGGYLSFYGPLMLGFRIYQKSNKEKLVYSLFFALSLFALYTSRSEAGVLGFIVAIAVLILGVIIRKIVQNNNSEIPKNKIIFLVTSIASALIILPLILSFVQIEKNPLERIRKEAIQILGSSDKNTDYKAVGPINDIRRMDERSIEIVVNNEPLNLTVDNSKIRITGNNQEVIYENLTSQIPDRENQRLENITSFEAYLKLAKTEDPNIYGISLYLKDYRGVLYFISDEMGLSISNALYKPLEIDSDFSVAPYIGFEGKGELGSGRGYIWSRSLPLVGDNIIIGTGQDTFITQFPQYDIFGRQVEDRLSRLWILTDKPHSLYLQIAIHSGLLSLAILLAGFILLTYKSIKLSVYPDNKAFIINAALIGFMVSSIFNDSILAITPIVYVLVGVNVVCILNHKSEKAVD